MKARVTDSTPPGVVVGTVSLGIVVVERPDDDPGIRTCYASSSDKTFNVKLTVAPPIDRSYMGRVRYVGFCLMVAVWATTVGFAIFVYIYRKARIVRVMQPMFLIILCVGVFILASTILPMSFDDDIISQEQCSRMCATTPWFASIGCCIIFSSLFSKLWRVNKLIHAERFHRLKVTEKVSQMIISSFVFLSF